MPQTAREIVNHSVKFLTPERMPRDLWLLPWAQRHFPEAVKEMENRYPSDLTTTEYFYKPSTCVKGDPHLIGTYIDEWSCIFTNIQDGVIGEVRTPIITESADWKIVRPPYEQLPKTKVEKQAAYDVISRHYDSTEKFVLANICPRPWERYQFLRGSENSYIDIMMPDKGAKNLLTAIHEFYLTEVEFWAKAKVDAIRFMDDWGAQKQLLIPPRIWRELFKPLYKDYCDLAHSNDKFVFMHSDGYIQEIYEDIIEIGVDALNSQLFVMHMDYLQKAAKGRITFWGEIDRQHVLPADDPEIGRQAVRVVAEKLYDPHGGIIAQFEFGAGANPDTALAVFDEWEKWDRTHR